MFNKHKTVLISFADERFQKSQHLNTWAGKYLGHFDEVIEYTPADIDIQFFRENEEILSLKRGAGGWLWKPYIIQKTLRGLSDGDYLMYCDAGSFFIHQCDYIFKDICERDIWVSDIPLIEKQWCKPSLIEYFEEKINTIALEENQIQGGFIGIRKSDVSVAFVNEWLRLCCNPDLILPMKENEDHGICIAHREDQSILSLLCKAKGIKSHKDPSQYGRIPEKYHRKEYLFSVPSHTTDKYPVLIILHRTGNCNTKVILKQWLCAILPKKIVYRLIK